MLTGTENDLLLEVRFGVKAIPTGSLYCIRIREAETAYDRAIWTIWYGRKGIICRTGGYGATSGPFDIVKPAGIRGTGKRSILYVLKQLPKSRWAHRWGASGSIFRNLPRLGTLWRESVPTYLWISTMLSPQCGGILVLLLSVASVRFPFLLALSTLLFYFLLPFFRAALFYIEAM